MLPNSDQKLLAKLLECFSGLIWLSARCYKDFSILTEHAYRIRRARNLHDSEMSEDDEVDSAYVSDSSQSTSIALKTNEPLPSAPPVISEVQETGTDILADLKVQYLHRSARDFLEKPEIWDKITAATKENFDPHLALCGMHVMHLKIFRPHKSLAPKLWKTVVPCLVHLSEVHAATENLETSLIDQLELVMRHHGNVADFKICLPAITVKFGIHKYVQAKLDRGIFPFVDEVGQPLLNITILHQKTISSLAELAGVDQTTKKQPPLPDLRTAKLLLEHGADPNQKYHGSTPWINLFVQASIRRPYTSTYGIELKKRWIDAIELFLRHGADPEASKEISSGQALRTAFRYSDAARVAELEALLNKKLRLCRGTKPRPRKPKRSPLVCMPLRRFA